MFNDCESGSVHLPGRKELWAAVQKERRRRTEGSRHRAVVLDKKANKWLCRVSFLQGFAGVYEAGHLTRADQAMPDGLAEDSTSGRAEATLHAATRGLARVPALSPTERRHSAALRVRE